MPPLDPIKDRRRLPLRTPRPIAIMSLRLRRPLLLRRRFKPSLLLQSERLSLR